VFCGRSQSCRKSTRKEQLFGTGTRSMLTGPITNKLNNNSVEPELEVPFPYLQDPSNSPYPEPTGSTSPPPPANVPNNKIHSDPILPPTHQSSQWSLSFGLSHHNPVQFPLSHAYYMPCSHHSPLFDVPNNIWGGV
jgi:hypothetical protein